jgi:SAM-dependent methyltransferase
MPNLQSTNLLITCDIVSQRPHLPQTDPVDLDGYSAGSHVHDAHLSALRGLVPRVTALTMILARSRLGVLRAPSGALIRCARAGVASDVGEEPEDWVLATAHFGNGSVEEGHRPCGTGKYFPLVAAAGHRVAGVDRSAGMLARARARGIAFALEHKALQDLSYDRDFDAVITVDAMENVPPGDWPLVLANLHRAGRPDGVMYCTRLMVVMRR